MLMRFHSTSWIAFSDDWKAHQKAETSEISPFALNLFARNLKASRKWKWLRGKKIRDIKTADFVLGKSRLNRAADEILSKFTQAHQFTERQAKCVLILDAGLGIQWQHALLGFLRARLAFLMLMRFIVRSTVFIASLTKTNSKEFLSLTHFSPNLLEHSRQEREHTFYADLPVFERSRHDVSRNSKTKKT